MVGSTAATTPAQAVQELTDVLIHVWEEIPPGDHQSSHQECARTGGGRAEATHAAELHQEVLAGFMDVLSACDLIFLL